MRSMHGRGSRDKSKGSGRRMGVKESNERKLPRFDGVSNGERERITLRWARSAVVERV
jgi:hypothetical protein